MFKFIKYSTFIICVTLVSCNTNMPLATEKVDMKIITISPPNRADKSENLSNDIINVVYPLVSKNSERCEHAYIINPTLFYVGPDGNSTQSLITPPSHEKGNIDNTKSNAIRNLTKKHLNDLKLEKAFLKVDTVNKYNKLATLVSEKIKNDSIIVFSSTLKKEAKYEINGKLCPVFNKIDDVRDYMIGLVCSEGKIMNFILIINPPAHEPLTTTPAPAKSDAVPPATSPAKPGAVLPATPPEKLVTPGKRTPAPGKPVTPEKLTPAPEKPTPAPEKPTPAPVYLKAPTNLSPNKIKLTSTSSVKLSWTKNNDAGATYQIKLVKLDGASETVVSNYEDVGDKSTKEVTGLKSGDRYRWRVRVLRNGLTIESTDATFAISFQPGSSPEIPVRDFEKK